jgi:tRNA U34 5-methylaminomethyl-2-thiouridine-forming methyltransferase MnmC
MPLLLYQEAMDEIEIITTSDGSQSLRNNRLNETYHSVHGALQESMHVFIKHGLKHYCEAHPGTNISILEVGFGTGLNALLTLQFAIQNEIHIRYTTLEPFPLPENIWSKLNYGGRLDAEDYFTALHQADFNSEVVVAPQFTLIKIGKGLEEVQLNEVYDVIYFDAFAPSVQPELWMYDSLRKVTVSLKMGGVFVTYSAKGQLKRDLKSLGLQVETLPGPPGKNEMVRATHGK